MNIRMSDQESILKNKRELTDQPDSWSRHIKHKLKQTWSTASVFGYKPTAQYILYTAFHFVKHKSMHYATINVFKWYFVTWPHYTACFIQQVESSYYLWNKNVDISCRKNVDCYCKNKVNNLLLISFWKLLVVKSNSNLLTN